jgi:hypothetical protein
VLLEKALVEKALVEKALVEKVLVASARACREARVLPACIDLSSCGR